MKLLFKGSKWDKEIHDIEKFYGSTNEDMLQSVFRDMNRFKNSKNKDFLELYFSLGEDYLILAQEKYLLESNNRDIVKYMFLSGICKLITAFLWKNGLRSDNFTNAVIANELEKDSYTMCLQLLAVDILPSFLMENQKNSLLIKMYNRDFENSRAILNLLPENPDDSHEVYYKDARFLKGIMFSIIEKNEKAFNEEIEKRIKKYRRNMVGYSTIIDYVSIALIKLAEREGIHCNVDVIEIPKQFFDKELLGKLDIHELPYFDECLKTGMLDGFKWD